MHQLFHNPPLPSPPSPPQHLPAPPTAGPTAIPFWDGELGDASIIHPSPVAHTTRYNLRSQARHIIQSAIQNGLDIPRDHIAFAVIDKTTGKALEYKDLIHSAEHKELWTTSYANELGRLTQDIRDIPGTNTMFFIHKNDIPQDRRKDITYSRIVVALRPQKKEPARTRLTVGGNLIDYPWDVATPTSDLTTAKLLFNSVVSTPGAVFVVLDVKNFYLNTPMERPEYMRLPLKLIPPEIIAKYNLRDKADDKGFVYVRIELGMYGLPQAGLLANKLLAQRLQIDGYYQCQYTPGLWRHVWRPITFSLVVDDFRHQDRGSHTRKTPQTGAGKILRGRRGLERTTLLWRSP
eukprot:CCRYP_018994-RD/>CCRYP_018994-RD protein AED:0.39 eAED:0.39 QI:0/-1/0/1/-1/0/1/0/348